MAKLAAITLNDNTATAQTFDVVKQVGTESTLRNNGNSAVVSERDFIALTFRPEKANAPLKASAKIVCPASSAERTLDETVDDVTIFIHVIRKENAAEERVQRCMAYAKDLLSNAIVTDMVENAAQPY